MNHKAAKQRLTDKQWDYTKSNKRTGCYPIGYCGLFPYEEPFNTDKIFWFPEDEYNMEKARLEPYRHKFHTTGHATAEEACDCYKEYLLDQNLRFGTLKDIRHKCQAKEGCEEFTDQTAEVGHSWYFHLCEKHKTREEVAKHFDVGESWGSY